MSNKLREIFTKEMTKTQKEMLFAIKQDLVDAKDCIFCEYGDNVYDGISTFCTLSKRNICEFGYGSNCEYWKLNDKVNKDLNKLKLELESEEE